MSNQLILIRHGKSVWNKKNIFTGWVDVDLDSEGTSEALKAAQLISKVNLRKNEGEIGIWSRHFSESKNSLIFDHKDDHLRGVLG